MIVRTWSGRTKAEAAGGYGAYLERTGVADCRATAGNRGVLVLRRREGDEARFWFLSFWDSMDSIRAFAGEDAERARYYDEDASYLLELPPTVEHYEVSTWAMEAEGLEVE